jgi:biopolymer transport protein ExbB
MILTSTTLHSQPDEVTNVRNGNLTAAFRHVRRHGPCTRGDIAGATGLNKATVTSLVTELLDRRLLRETGSTGHRVGRPATMLVIDGDPYVAVGIEVGLYNLTAVAGTLGGTRLLTWRRAVDGTGSTPGQLVTAVSALARRVTSKMAKENRRVLGIAVGLPESLHAGRDASEAPLEQAINAEMLASALGNPPYPVEADRCAVLAAAAEHRYGDRSGSPDLVCLTCETGIAAGIIAERLWTLRRERVIPSHLVAQVWHWLKKDQLDEEHIKALRNNSPLGRVLAAGLGQRHGDRDLIKESVEDTGRHVVHELERYLNTLGTIAAITPLLGLLGTVIGMVRVFTAITAHGVGDPGALAGGISEALLTTAAGLTVAIPSLIAYRYLRGRVDELVVDMEQEAIKLRKAMDHESTRLNVAWQKMKHDYAQKLTRYESLVRAVDATRGTRSYSCPSAASRGEH